MDGGPMTVTFCVPEKVRSPLGVAASVTDALPAAPVVYDTLSLKDAPAARLAQ